MQWPRVDLILLPVLCAVVGAVVSDRSSWPVRWLLGQYEGMIRMVAGNAEQAQAWNGEQGETWLRFEDEFNRAIRGYGEKLVAAAAIQPTDRVLDIGCGSGEVTRAAARMAVSGNVLGIDLSSLLAGRARERAHEEALVNLHYEVGDGQLFGFDAASFDVAVSRFGVMFFADAVAAFANIRRAMAEDGRLVMITWQPLEDNEWHLEMRLVLAQGRELPRPESGVPGPFALSDPAYVKDALGAAGWREVSFESVREPYLAGEDAAGAFRFLSEQSVARGLLSELDEAGRKRALTELQDSISRHQTVDGIMYESAAWLVSAGT